MGFSYLFQLFAHPGRSIYNIVMLLLLLLFLLCIFLLFFPAACNAHLMLYCCEASACSRDDDDDDVCRRWVHGLGARLAVLLRCCSCSYCCCCCCCYLLFMPIEVVSVCVARWECDDERKGGAGVGECWLTYSLTYIPICFCAHFP